MVVICKYMGWDLYTYLAQPEWFVSAIMTMMVAEADAAKRKPHGNGS